MSLILVTANDQLQTSHLSGKYLRYLVVVFQVHVAHTQVVADLL